MVENCALASVVRICQHSDSSTVYMFMLQCGQQTLIRPLNVVLWAWNYTQHTSYVRLVSNQKFWSAVLWAWNYTQHTSHVRLVFNQKFWSVLCTTVTDRDVLWKRTLEAMQLHCTQIKAWLNFKIVYTYSWFCTSKVAVNTSNKW